MSSNVLLRTLQPATARMLHIARRFVERVMSSPSTRPPALPTSRPAELTRRASSTSFLLLALAALLLLVAQPVSAQDPPASNDATLNLLWVTQTDTARTVDIFSPRLALGSGFTARVASGVAQVNVRATTNDVNASVTINGEAGNTATIDLDYGDNRVTIVVTAQDGATTKTYTLTVKRAYLAPTITSVTPGAASGGPTLTVVTTNPSSTTYDVVIQISKSDASWPASRGTSHQLPSGVSRDAAASSAGSDVFTGFEKGTAYTVRAHLKTKTATPTAIDYSSSSRAVTAWNVPGKPTAASDAVSTVWSSTLTVDVSGSSKGCDNDPGGMDNCTATLTSDRFTFGGKEYRVSYLYVDGGYLNTRMAVSGDPSPTLRAGSLRIGGSSGSTYALSSGFRNVYYWSGGPSWSDNQQVTIEIIVPATEPTVTAGAGKLTVTWAAPADTGGPGASITGYDVQYKETSATDQAAATQGDPSTGWVDAGHSGTTASAEITGLTGEIQYDVRVRALNGISPGSAWVTGQGTPQPNTFSITATSTAAEGESATLTITLSENAPQGGVSFSVSTDFTSQTASSMDVGTAPTTVTVASGQTEATLAIPLAKDALDESSESFEVSISTSASGWTTISDSDNTATVTITDNTPVVSFGLAAYQVTEGDGAIEIDVRAVGAHPGFTVSATAVAGTADGTDFTAGTSSLEFGVGDDVVLLSIPIASDVVADYALEAAEETFTVTLSTGGDYALGSPATTTVTIHDAGYCHTTATPPGKPSFTSVTPAETSITLTWNAPSTTGSGLITNFIFRVYSTDGQHVPVADVMGNISAAHNYSKTISGLTAGTTYLVKMRARTILGCYSPYTDKLSVTTLTDGGQMQ